MPPSKKQDTPEITKRRVTMVNYLVLPPTDGQSEPTIEKHEAVDYVRPDFLDAYVADAHTKWQQVTVSEEPDAGPGGYEGDTVVPDHLTNGGNL